MTESRLLHPRIKSPPPPCPSPRIPWEQRKAMIPNYKELTHSERRAALRQAVKELNAEEKQRAARKQWEEREMNKSLRAAQFGKHLYLIREAGHGHFKVGRATSPKSRLADLQRGNPWTLTLERVYQDLGHLETVVHEVFDDCRLRGEWFDASAFEAIVESIDAHVELLKAA